MENIKLKSISLKSCKCFEDTIISFSKDNNAVYQWTVFIGNNNSGKTNLLRTIANVRPGQIIAFPDGKNKMSQYSVPVGFNESRKSNLDLEINWEVTKFEGEYYYSKKECKVLDEKYVDGVKIYGYGVSRYSSKKSLSDSQCDDCASLFSADTKLINLEDWLMQLKLSSEQQNAAKIRLERIKKVLCGEIFPDILDFRFESSDELHNSVSFQTVDGWFPYTELGYGYQSMLSWVVDLCKRMFERYPESENPLNENAIVLVDEIDLHLHPQWQRDIIPFLSKTFPNVQFIVSTHSPLVLQSFTEVNLFTLHRSGEKVVIEHKEAVDYRGWSVEEILRDVLMMEDDVFSDELQELMKKFDDGLDKRNKKNVEEAYVRLASILHPESTLRRIVELQCKRFLNSINND